MRMDEQERQLISRLSNLVEAATATSRLRGSGSNVEQGQEAAAAPETSNNVEDTLKELYPSIDCERSQSRQGMEIGIGLPPASTRFDPRRSDGRSKAKKSNRKVQGGSTGSSSNTLTKARNQASNQQSQSKTVTLMDVFFQKERWECKIYPYQSYKSTKVFHS